MPTTPILVLRVANVLFGLLALGVGSASFGLLTYPVLDSASGEHFMAAMGGLISVVMLGLALTHFFVGVVLGPGRGRGAQTLLAVALVMTFPLGTIYALFALWVCWANPETRQLLDGEKPLLPFARATA